MLSLVGVLILCLLVWIVGPYFAFGSLRPLDDVWERVLFMLLAFAVWGGVFGYRRLRARRADAALKEELGRSASRASARDNELAGKFEEALKALREQRGRSASLYELPWYVIIGPPGAGKTTAIQNSGVEFPLSQRFGKDAVRGIGGTRNCDWWFTDRAVLLDTAGRYVTQDSDAAGDAEEWREFLRLLRRHRKRRPVNGVLLAISVADLMSMDGYERGRHVLAVRDRLEELNRAFGIQLPVYVLFTKVDLLSGFSEFFEDLSPAEREQVWGVTGRWTPDGAGDVMTRLTDDYDDLVRQLSRRLTARLSAERDLGRRSLIQGFPQQFAALRPRVAAFLEDVFGNGFDERIVLRGFYFTSGTQVGVPFDQLIESLGRGLGLEPSPRAGDSFGRSYFLTRLLGDVVFRESGLVGRNRRLELKLLAAKTAALAAVAVCSGLLLAAWIVSYQNNSAYLAEVRQTLAEQAGPLATGASLDYRAVLPRLDALREVYQVAARHQADVPLTMGFGLYQGDDVAAAAEAAYRRELNAALLPLLSRDFQQAVAASAGEPVRLYEFLKAYLMLVEPEHFESAHVAFLSERILAQRHEPGSSDYQRLVAHVEHLLSAPLAPVERNDALIDGARSTLGSEPLEALMFSRLSFDVRAAHPRGLAVRDAIGLNADTVFVSASRGDLEVTVPFLYTAEGFAEVTGTTLAAAVASFVEEGWVFGAGFAPRLVDSLELVRRLEAHYEHRYIDYWDELLADLRFDLAPGAGRAELVTLLDQVSRKPSPLDGVLRLVVAQTNLSAASASGGDGGGLAQVFGAAVGRVTGQAITRHFEPLHNAASEIDRLKQGFSDLYVELAGGRAAVPADGAAARLQVLAASQPEPLRGWIAQVSGSGQSLSRAAQRRRIAEAWQADVLPVCKRAIAGRYPLAGGDGEVPMGDFSRFFGPGGILAQFFDANLAAFVDRRGGSYRWNQQGAALGIPSTFLALFQDGAQVRDAFFGSAAEPRIRFRLTPQYLDASVDRVVLSYDGKPLSYSHGPQIPWELSWPPADSRRTEVVFHLPGGEQPALSATGVWGLFRLLDNADVRPEFDAGAFVSFTLAERSVTFRLEADSIENPFVNNELRGFRCPAGV